MYYEEEFDSDSPRSPRSPFTSSITSMMELELWTVGRRIKDGEREVYHARQVEMDMAVLTANLEAFPATNGYQEEDEQ
eukprot:4663735-Prorocentrum_lima.AAC.1